MNRISECCKLTQKEYNSRHDKVGKVIHWEMCKKLKFYQTNKLYIHNPADVLENDSHKLIWDFNIQTYHLISVRRLETNNNQQQKKREYAKLLTLLCRLTTEQNRKNVKRRISTSILLRSWKNYGTWKWQLYQSWLMLLVE